jgi:hypothetical protein
VEETLKILVWGLVPQLPLPRSCIGIGDLFLAGPPRRGGAIFGGLVTTLLLRRSASFWISRHSVALWRAPG